MLQRFCKTLYCCFQRVAFCQLAKYCNKLLSVLYFTFVFHLQNPVKQDTLIEQVTCPMSTNFLLLVCSSIAVWVCQTLSSGTSFLGLTFVPQHSYTLHVMHVCM